jgi:hypothetical protein
MPQTLPESSINSYLRPDHQVRIGFHLPDETVIDLNAVVIGIEGVILHLEAFGSGVSELSQIPIGSPVIILSSESWAFCRCQGVLDETLGRDFTVRLLGEPEIQQRREHFRLDVLIPVAWSVPDDQQLTVVEGLWKARRMMEEFGEQPRATPYQESFKILNWHSWPEITPCHINLSGGGIRLKTYEEFTPGTLMDMVIFLPLRKIKAISVVSSVIRSSEIRLTIDNRTSYMTALQFAFIAERDREAIINYIFHEQRNSLRKRI